MRANLLWLPNRGFEDKQRNSNVGTTSKRVPQVRPIVWGDFMLRFPCPAPFQSVPWLDMHSSRTAKFTGTRISG
jgi:hypothetical protein